MQSLEEAVLKAVEVYNQYRSPEATARLVRTGRDELVVDFEGTFCRTCGVYDWLEDLIYELVEISDFELEILDFENVAPETIRVRYRVKAVGNTNQTRT